MQPISHSKCKGLATVAFTLRIYDTLQFCAKATALHSSPDQGSDATPLPYELAELAAILISR